MTQEKNQTELAQAQPYREMDTLDENAILAEMRQEFLEEFVYQFERWDKRQKKNVTVTSLSYTGIKESVRRLGTQQKLCPRILDFKTEDVNGKIRATVRMRDDVSNMEVLGTAEEDATKEFAFVLANSKAERNAYAKLIPAKFFAELIAEKLAQGNPVNVTPKPQTKVVDVKPAAAPPQQPPTPQDQPAPFLHLDTIQDVKDVIPPTLHDKINVEMKGNYFIVKLNGFLGSENFQVLREALQAAGGEYISAGKDSHFRVKVGDQTPAA